MKAFLTRYGLLLALLALAGCSGNYKYSDDDYRPLGDPAPASTES